MSENKQRTKIESSANVKSLEISGLSKILKRGLRAFAYYGIALAIIIFVLFVAWSIIRTFPDYVPISNADNLLQIWITANGVLLGFVGIIFAQLLSSTMDQQNVLYQRILNKTETAYTKELKKILDYLDRRRLVLSITAASTLMLFAYSILLSMEGIARNSLLEPTDVYAVNGFMSGPLLYSLIGITVLTMSLVLPLKPPTEISSNS